MNSSCVAYVRVYCIQGEAVMRLFHDKSTGPQHKALLLSATRELTELAYQMRIWVTDKWHLIACPHNYPKHLSLFGGLGDLMEMVCEHMHVCVCVCVCVLVGLTVSGHGGVEWVRGLVDKVCAI
jgi:hypothetical protein